MDIDYKNVKISISLLAGTMMHFMQQQKLILLKNIVANFPLFHFLHIIRKFSKICNLHDNAQFTSKAKINIFGNLFYIVGSKAPCLRLRNIFPKMSILAIRFQSKKGNTHFPASQIPAQFSPNKISRFPWDAGIPATVTKATSFSSSQS